MGIEQTVAAASGGGVTSAAADVSFDQAIFTSVRNPMGEGYRIIAASAGLTPHEKQVITRTSPSHDALCDPSADATGVACYPLPAGAGAPGMGASSFAQRRAGDGSRPALDSPPPSGRICIAYTCRAGAEHTGRGLRIYTYNLIVDQDGFAQFGYNPFCILRAAQAADLTRPQLKPKQILEPVTLTPACDTARYGKDPLCSRYGKDHLCSTRSRYGKDPLCSSGHQTATDACQWMRHVLQGLLRRRKFVVRTEGDAIDSAEVLWMGLPGPVRFAASVSAGIRFSMARCRDLNIIAGDKDVTPSRAQTVCAPTAPTASDQAVEELDASRWAGQGAGEDHSLVGQRSSLPSGRAGWIDLVTSHWQQGTIAALADRTSKPFTDITPAGLDRIARLYLASDEASSADIPRLFALASESLEPQPSRLCHIKGAEADVADQLLSVVADRLLARLKTAPIDVVERHWTSITDLWKGAEREADFSQPLVEACLRRVGNIDPPAAARLALDVSCGVRDSIDAAAHESLITTVLGRFADWCEKASWESLPDLQNVCEIWQRRRPDCEFITRAAARCHTFHSRVGCATPARFNLKNHAG